MSEQVQCQDPGCILIAGHRREHFVPQDSGDHSDIIRLRILRDRAEIAEEQRDALVAALGWALQYGTFDSANDNPMHARAHLGARAALAKARGEKAVKHGADCLQSASKETAQ